MITINLNSFNSLYKFIADNPSYQINDINIVSKTEIIVIYTD